MSDVELTIEENQIDESQNKRIRLEEITNNFFSKWYRRLLRHTLRKMVAKATELRDGEWNEYSTCGCYVSDKHNTLCFWHGMEAYLR